MPQDLSMFSTNRSPHLVVAEIVSLLGCCSPEDVDHSSDFRVSATGAAMRDGFPTECDLRSPLYYVCTYDDGDPPSVWSMKVRLLAATGRHRDAKRELDRVAPVRLAALPRDRDYLGTLGALARAALVLGARDYCEALYPFLVPYEDHFAVHVSFICEGSVGQLCGELSAALGQSVAAHEHFERCRARSELAGIKAIRIPTLQSGDEA